MTEILGGKLGQLNNGSSVGTAILSADGVVAGFGRTPVCDPVSFELSAGASMAIVGPNGAGKSTVARTLCGQQPPLAGRSYFRGGPVDERSASFRRQVATIFDEDAFFPGLTVAEHLLMTAHGHRVAKPAKAVESELEFFELGDHGESMPDELSSGQRRRLLLASALIRPATLLVLDEPEQRLDVRMRRELASRLNSATGQGSTLLLITHDPLLLTDVAEQCMVVDEQIRFLSPDEAAAVISA